MASQKQEDLTIREKIAIRLVLFLIQLIQPYEYEHQFKEYFREMKELIGIKVGKEN